MKALVLQAFGRLAVHDRPDPEPAADEVVVRVAYTGICGSDIHGYTGENGRRSPGQVMGHESAGHVAAIGSDVIGFEVGQAVTFNPVVVPEAHLEQYRGREQHDRDKIVIGVTPDVSAAFAELVAVPARNLVTLPSGMPLRWGALVEPLAVAVHAVRRARVRPSDRAIVLGGGPIGQSVVLALRMAGVHEIAVTEVDPARRALLAQLGAVTFDPLASPVSDQVQNHFGAPADVAIDAVGLSATMADGLRSTRAGGTVCLVGMGARQLEIVAFDISVEERTIVGSFTYAAIDFEDAAAWVATATQDLDVLISREVGMDQADAAFAALASGDGTPGKVLVRINEETSS